MLRSTTTSTSTATSTAVTFSNRTALLLWQSGVNLRPEIYRFRGCADRFAFVWQCPPPPSWSVGIGLHFRFWQLDRRISIGKSAAPPFSPARQSFNDHHQLGRTAWNAGHVSRSSSQAAHFQWFHNACEGCGRSIGKNLIKFYIFFIKIIIYLLIFFFNVTNIIYNQIWLK